MSFSLAMNAMDAMDAIVNCELCIIPAKPILNFEF